MPFPSPHATCARPSETDAKEAERVTAVNAADVRAVNGYGRPFLENAKVRTPIRVEHGPWSGFLIRRARGMFSCDDRCGACIRRGQLYLQGEAAPDRAGGFGHDRLCVKCAGPMALHAISAAMNAELTAKAREPGQ